MRNAMTSYKIDLLYVKCDNVLLVCLCLQCYWRVFLCVCLGSVNAVVYSENVEVFGVFLVYGLVIVVFTPSYYTIRLFFE